jgi:Ca-activated chloride channel family protein
MKKRQNRFPNYLWSIAMLLWLVSSCSQNTSKKTEMTYDMAIKDQSQSYISAPPVPSMPEEPISGESYQDIPESRFMKTEEEPFSTFSIDVDRASYSNIRRFLNTNQLPPAQAVRLEEMINYFDYEYKQPSGSQPFAVNTEMTDCPWNAKHRLVRIGLQGKDIKPARIPSSNLVFLIDVSGSMEEDDKLPLLQKSFHLLVNQLRKEDYVSIVVYAGAAGLVLPPTSGSEKNTILSALDNLKAGGSTAGGEGLKLAYKVAKQNYIPKGNNRIILATDGDFNVGVSSDDEMKTLVETERQKGVFMSVLGFGTGNYQDSKMEIIADNGNGNYFYIDSEKEANKIFVQELQGILLTIAKDVKIQMAFNPQTVKSYRLMGYENRILSKEDFTNDKKDAGEIGAGHTVTALYEIEMNDNLVAANSKGKKADLLKKESFSSGDLFSLRLRYKQPDAETSQEIVYKKDTRSVAFADASTDMKFASSIAGFGMLLKDSQHKGNLTYERVIEIAGNAKGTDPNGYRAEAIELIKKAAELSHHVAESIKTDELR